MIEESKNPYKKFFNGSPAEPAEPNIFTTERKKPKTTINISRKGSIAKEKSRQLTEIALNLFPNRIIPDVDLTDLILLYIGGDKETIRAYKGFNGGRIRRSKRSGEGYVPGQPRKGYLELFGFMHKVGHSRWVIHAQGQLFPNTSEGVCGGFGSKEKISISPSHEVVSLKRVEAEESIHKINNNNTTGKERNFVPKIFPKISVEAELTADELAILRAKPSGEKGSSG